MPCSWGHQGTRAANSTPLLCSLLNLAAFTEHPLGSAHQLLWLWPLNLCLCLFSLYLFLLYSHLFSYSFRNAFGNKSSCKSFTINTSPEEVSSTRIAITRQSLLIYLLLSPMFNYSLQNKMSPGAALKQNSNPQVQFPWPAIFPFKWEREWEAQKITSHESIQLISFCMSSSPKENFLHPVKPKIAFSDVWRWVFQKSMVNMLQTAHRQRKWSTKFKIIWLRQHQQMRVIFSHEGRELKSLIKTNMKWTARKVHHLLNVFCEL